MFFGREKELNLINDILAKKSASMMIYGKRKVGKTTLITHALQNHSDKFVYFECLKSSMQDNIDSFVSILVLKKVLPVAAKYKSFADVFTHINTLPGTYNIVIDEYPYLKEFTNGDTVDSIFQSIIDNSLSNVRLFISGSHVGMMKDLLEERNALYNRFTYSLCLKELNYKSISAFYANKSVHDKVAFYAVFGGSPYINEFIDPTRTLKENVVSTVLNQSSGVYHYANNLLLSDLSVSSNMERIFYAIANGKKKYSEIQNKLALKENGTLSKQMKILLDMELVRKVLPINRLDDNKKARYEINDNLLRFFYAYVYSNKSALQMLGANAFYDAYIEPSLTTFISHRFEELCRDYFSMQVQNGQMSGVMNIGTFYYDDAKTKSNGEFDVVIQRKNAYDFYEAKYYSSALTTKQMNEEIKQVRAIPGLPIGNIGFISVNGFEDSCPNDLCIDGNKLYE